MKTSGDNWHSTQNDCKHLENDCGNHETIMKSKQNKNERTMKDHANYEIGMK
jgi:hypothetical protein